MTAGNQSLRLPFCPLCVVDSSETGILAGFSNVPPKVSLSKLPTKRLITQTNIVVWQPSLAMYKVVTRVMNSNKKSDTITLRCTVAIICERGSHRYLMVGC